ncbi:MAG TPA: hypothetical protein VNT79_02195 [Phycisphaerae bacterium]|nr:hypothetical protein [Phycisphaerae bacterium]
MRTTFWIVGLLLLAGCDTGLGVPAGFTATDLDGYWQITSSGGGVNCLTISGGIIVDKDGFCDPAWFDYPHDDSRTFVNGDRITFVIDIIFDDGSGFNQSIYELERQSDGTLAGTYTSSFERHPDLVYGATLQRLSR